MDINDEWKIGEKETGLLATLDSHKRLHPIKPVEKVDRIESDEVEYQLYSYGKIYPSHVGTEPLSILTDFPFKLFNSSTPPSPQPQKLCLTFRAPYEYRGTVIQVYSTFSHETAKEFAAFLSLLTRRRVFVGKQTRCGGLPIEEEIDIYPRSYFQKKQGKKEIKPKEVYKLLENLQAMDKSIAKGFILAMRLYHSAIAMMYTEPELSYIFLVTCLEAISSAVYKDYRPDNEEEFLDSRFPGWGGPLKTLPLDQRAELKEVLLKGENFMRSKIFNFVNENVPEHFWSEEEDDAKSEDMIFKTIPGYDYFKDLEKIEKGKLKQVLKDIYNARSQLIHEGIRLPQIISFGLSLIPVEALAKITETSPFLEIPPLLTFERLVSYSMVEFMRKQQASFPK